MSLGHAHRQLRETQGRKFFQFLFRRRVKINRARAVDLLGDESDFVLDGELWGIERLDAVEIGSISRFDRFRRKFEPAFPSFLKDVGYC